MTLRHPARLSNHRICVFLVRLRKALTDWAAHLPPNLRGSLWLLASAVLFTLVGVMAKKLGQRFDSFQIAFFRGLAGALLTLPFLIRAGVASFKTKQPMLQLLRTLLAATAITANFYALVHLPLADANAISFARSLFLVPLAIVFLGETVGARRAGATIVGFIGVMIVLRPTGTIEWAAFVAIIGALAVATAAICVKILLRTDSLLTLLFYAGVASSVILAVPAYLVWRPPDLADLLALITLGGVAVAAQGCFIRGFAIGEVTALAPVDYTRLLFAALAGYVFFLDIPDVWMWTGSAIIVASTLYITRREAQLGKQNPPPPPIAARDAGFVQQEDGKKQSD